MWESLRAVRKYLWRYRGNLALGFLCLILKDLAHASQPLMIRRAIDSISQSMQHVAEVGSADFMKAALYLIGLASLKAIFQYWMRVTLIGISRDVEYDLRN